MGQRLHVRTKNCIEYGNGYFNQCYDFITTFFAEWFDNYDDRKIEIPEEEFKQILNLLSDIDKNSVENCDDDKYIAIKKLIEEKKITINEIKIIFQKWYDTADKNNGYICLDWF